MKSVRMPQANRLPYAKRQQAQASSVKGPATIKALRRTVKYGSPKGLHGSARRRRECDDRVALGYRGIDRQVLQRQSSPLRGSPLLSSREEGH